MAKQFIQHRCPYKTAAAAEAAIGRYRKKAERFYRLAAELLARAFAVWATEGETWQMKTLLHQSTQGRQKADYALLQAQVATNICYQFMVGERREG